MIDQHETCHHKTYKITCLDYDRLIDRAAGGCELCGVVASEKLHLDHDHEFGDMAVRGLVCRGCNATLAYIDSGHLSPDDRANAYMARAFFLSLANFRVLRGPEFNAAVEAISPRTMRALARYVRNEG